MERKFKQGPILPAMLEDLENKNKELLEALKRIADTQYRTNKTGKVDPIEIDALIRIAKIAIKKATE